MIEPGDYGPVHAVSGKHAGRIGYYDDDGDDDTAVVYFGEPFGVPYELVPYDVLEPATDDPNLSGWADAHPDAARALGVPTRRPTA